MHHQWKSLSVIFGVALSVALLAGLLMSLPQRMTDGIYAQQVESAAEAQENLSTAQGLSSAFRNVAESLRPSVVSISTTMPARGVRTRGELPPELRRQLPPWLQEDFFRQFEEPEQERSQPRGVGSGVIVRQDGYILTNNHLVEGADEVTVELSDGRTVTGEVVGTDPPTDLAVLKIDATGLHPATLGDSDAIQVGDWVLAIGSPFGLDQTVTAGIISGKNRVQGIVGGGQGFEDFLQTDAAINPGNSGGPLVNLHGEVVGVNTAILSRSGASAGIGFAIPVGLARPVVNAIIETGSVRRGFLGAQVDDVNPTTREEFDLQINSGALIRGVLDGQPAAVAGLQPGDVVTQMDGRPVNSGGHLRNYIAGREPGATVALTVQRNEKSLQLNVKLQERTEDVMAMFNGGRDGESVIGAQLEPLTPEMARELNLPRGARGLVVTSIEDGNLAARAELQVGDVIEQAAGRPLTSAKQLQELIAQSQQEQRILRMLIRRGNVQLMLVIR